MKVEKFRVYNIIEKLHEKYNKGIIKDVDEFAITLTKEVGKLTDEELVE